MRPQRLAVLLASVCLTWTAPASAQVVNTWNTIAVNCAAVNRPGASGVLDIAIIQGAVHDAVQAIQGRFEPYYYQDPSKLGAGSEEAAVAAATWSLLRSLYGNSAACLSTATDPATTYPGDPGLQAGNGAAQAFLPLYRKAFTLPSDPNTGGTFPGEWRPTPTAFAPFAFTYMAETQPFTLVSPRQFRPGPPPPLTSETYRRDYDEVKRLGCLNCARTTAQQSIANFWQNFIVQWQGALRSVVTNGYVPEIGDQARLFALASYAAADAGISCWETKLHYSTWRPITAIREGDVDGNPRTVGDTNWTSFLTTPPYPDHSSGANNITGSVTTILQLFLGTDEVTFTVPGPNSSVGPRSYTRISVAQGEVIEARIYQGIHFRFADEEGRRQGARVAHWVFQKFLGPVHGKN